MEAKGNFIPQPSPELFCDLCQARQYFHEYMQLWLCSNPYCCHKEAGVCA